MYCPIINAWILRFRRSVASISQAFGGKGQRVNSLEFTSPCLSQLAKTDHGIWLTGYHLLATAMEHSLIGREIPVAWPPCIQCRPILNRSQEYNLQNY